MREQCPECGSNTAYQQFVSNSYCHKCGYRTKDSGSIVQKPVDIVKSGVTYSNWSTTFPEKAKALLLKNWIGDNLIAKYNIRYTPNLIIDGKDYGERIIFPQYNENAELEFLEAKSLGHPIKYVVYGTKNLLYIPKEFPKGDILYIVEDIQSCIRVNEQYPCVALRGTSFNTEKLNSIIMLSKLHKFDTIGIWLDNDEAGKVGTMKLKSKLSLLFNTKIIRSDRDPKTYSDPGIQRWTIQLENT